MKQIFGLLLAGAVLVSGQFSEEEGTNVDVMQNEKAVLECRFDPALSGGDPVSFYWSHKNIREWDTVAIKENLFREQYSVDSDPVQGKYDLHISSATYEKDNGQFVCKVRQVGTGSELHTEKVNLTVLMPPNPPNIAPQELPLNEGQPAVLECSSDGGSPPPEIRWYRRGTTSPLPAEWSPAADRSLPTVSRVTLEPTREDDSQQLECVVHNRAMAEGERLTAVTQLDVNYYPRIAVGPENPLRVELGSFAQLQCTVDAKPAAEGVRWIRNNAFVSDDVTLDIDQVAHDDAGPYTCSAQNEVAESKEELILDVLYAPTVSVEEEREVPDGGSVQILCEADANPPVEEVFWLREDDEEFRSEGATLRLSRVTAEDNGKYICVAVNSILSYGMGEPERRYGNATTSILIRHAPGQAFIVPENPIGVEGRSLTLTCDARPPGHPTPKYLWTHASRPGVPLGFGANLTIDQVQQRDAGEYTCEPENVLARGAPATVHVDVFRAPEIDTRMPEEETRASDTTAFEATCSAEGMPKPSVTWLKDGVEVSTADGSYDVTIDESELNDRVFAVRSTLFFRGRAREQDRLSPLDRGNYSCRFQNPAGTAETTMLLRIRHAPIVYHQYSKVAFDEGEEAEIACQMVAYPAPTFRWSRQGAPLDSDPTGFYAVNASGLGNDVHQTTLYLAQVRPQDFGQYVCQAQNAEGEHSTALTLQPKSRPEPPTDVHEAETGTSWALLDWTPGFDGGFSDTIYYVLLKDGNRERPFDCQTRRPCNVTSLQHQTTYTVQIRANNDKGDSAYSPEAEFTTALDLEQLPLPQSAKFERESRRLNFNVVGASMDVVGVLDVRSDESGWVPTDQQVEVNNNFGNAEVSNVAGDVSDVRVRLCLRGNVSVCGPPVLAQHVPIDAMVVPSAGMPLELIIIIVVVIIALLVALVITFICCKRNKSPKKTNSKNFNDDAYNRQKMPGYYPPGGAPDNKQTVDATDLARMNQEPNKASIYSSRPGYEHALPHPDHVPAGGPPPPNGAINMAYMDNSYSNSNNGGSVNSQDSLWQVKAGGGVAPAAAPDSRSYGNPDNRSYGNPDNRSYGNPDTRSYGNPDTRSYGQPDNRSYGQPDTRSYGQPEGRPFTYDPNNYDPAQANYNPDASLHGYGDYAHYQPQAAYPPDAAYPTHDEYGRPYETDPYDPMGGRAPRPHHADGAYRDVSGLPDPYAAQEPENKPQISFDESLESGYSTPNSRNRRVIREIIV